MIKDGVNMKDKTEMIKNEKVIRYSRDDEYINEIYIYKKKSS